MNAGMRQTGSRLYLKVQSPGNIPRDVEYIGCARGGTYPAKGTCPGPGMRVEFGKTALPGFENAFRARIDAIVAARTCFYDAAFIRPRRPNGSR